VPLCPHGSKTAQRDFARITEVVGREHLYHKRLVRNYHTVRLSLFGHPWRSVVIDRQGWRRVASARHATHLVSVDEARPR